MNKEKTIFVVSLGAVFIALLLNAFIIWIVFEVINSKTVIYLLLGVILVENLSNTFIFIKEQQWLKEKIRKKIAKFVYPKIITLSQIARLLFILMYAFAFWKFGYTKSSMVVVFSGILDFFVIWITTKKILLKTP